MDLLVPLGFAGGVLVLAALAAGFVDRAPLSFPLLFLGLGLVLGEGATGALVLDLDAPLLAVVAVTLVSLVLFLDAVQLDVDALRKDWATPGVGARTRHPADRGGRDGAGDRACSGCPGRSPWSSVPAWPRPTP